MQTNTTTVDKPSPKENRLPLTIREYDCLRAVHHCRVLGRSPSEHQARRIVNGQCPHDHVDEDRATELFTELVDCGYLTRDRPHPAEPWRYALTTSGKTACRRRLADWRIMDEDPADEGGSE